MTEFTRYIENADVSTYFARFGDVPAAWSAATESEQTAAVEVASRWLDQTFGARWKGVRSESSQTRDWPRTGVYDRDGYSLSSTTTPTAVREAAAEAAVLHLQSLLSSVPDTATSVSIKSQTISAGDVSESITYVGGSSESASAQARFPKIEALLRDLLKNGGGTVESVPSWF